jgi:hypothetical protein
VAGVFRFLAAFRTELGAGLFLLVTGVRHVHAAFAPRGAVAPLFHKATWELPTAGWMKVSADRHGGDVVAWVAAFW